MTMTFRVTMKTPDALVDAILEAVGEIPFDGTDPDPDEDESDRADRETRVYGAYEVCEKWFRYGECVTLEIDTEAGTCVVVPSRG